MKTACLLSLLTAVISLSAFASDPETQATDEVNYDEDPYVILVGEADQAIAEENYEEAAQRLLDAMSVDPKRESNLLLESNLAMVYSYMDRDSLALTKLNNLLERAPRMSTALQNRARVYMKLGDDRSAYRDFETAISIDSLNLNSRYYHGMMALYGGRRDIARADFDVLEQQAPDALDTAVALGTYYSLVREDSKALPYLRRLVEDMPAPEFFSALAGCLLDLQQLSEASEVISDGLKRYSHDPELYYYRARLNKARYRLDDARADAKKAVEFGANPTKVKAIFE